MYLLIFYNTVADIHEYYVEKNNGGQLDYEGFLCTSAEMSDNRCFHLQ